MAKLLKNAIKDEKDWEADTMEETVTRKKENTTDENIPAEIEDKEEGTPKKKHRRRSAANLL